MRHRYSLLTLLLVLALVLPGLVQTQEQTIPHDGGEVRLSFPSDWQTNPRDNPFDLQMMSGGQDMNTGIFVYSRSDFKKERTTESILGFHINDLRSKRQNFQEMEPLRTEQRDGKSVLTAVYSGERNGSTNIYKFSAVTFEQHPEIIITFLQISLPDSWEKAKPILEAIPRSATFAPAQPASES